MSFLQTLKIIYDFIYYDTQFQYFSKWCISDEVKDLLAQTPLCKHLIKMAQVTLGGDTDLSEDNQQKVKMSSDLLILLLTGGDGHT